jgi:hypothetical protein
MPIQKKAKQCLMFQMIAQKWREDMHALSLNCKGMSGGKNLPLAKRRPSINICFLGMLTRIEKGRCAA